MRLIDADELLKQPLDKANYPSNYVRIAPTVCDIDAIRAAIEDWAKDPCVMNHGCGDEVLQIIDKYAEQEPSEDMTIAYLMGYYADKEPHEDAKSTKEVMQILTTLMSEAGKDGKLILSDAKEMIMDLPSVQPKQKTGRWIPMTTRSMTEEEREHYREWSDIDGAMIFDCELPEDGQEVLVSNGGYVCIDTFCKDDGCYFEGVDIDDVQAWMPLPKPYEPYQKGGKG